MTWLWCWLGSRGPTRFVINDQDLQAAGFHPSVFLAENKYHHFSTQKWERPLQHIFAFTLRGSTCQVLSPFWSWTGQRNVDHCKKSPSRTGRVNSNSLWKVQDKKRCTEIAQGLRSWEIRVLFWAMPWACCALYKSCQMWEERLLTLWRARRILNQRIWLRLRRKFS